MIDNQHDIRKYKFVGTNLIVIYLHLINSTSNSSQIGFKNKIYIHDNENFSATFAFAFLLTIFRISIHFHNP
jgi:hypothetical protein